MKISVKINETIRGADVYVIQSTSQPVNDSLMELLIMIDAMRRASAGRITAVIPYYGYARAGSKGKKQEIQISAKLVANLITTAGADRVLTMDLHCAQIGRTSLIFLWIIFREIPYLQITIVKNMLTSLMNLSAVSPDLGSVGRTRGFATRVDIPIAIIDKSRPKANVSEIMNIIGNVDGKRVILVDDMIDTAGTICNAARALVEKQELSR